MRPFTVATVQLLASTDPKENLIQVQNNLVKAADAGAQLVVFPEATMANLAADLVTLAEPLDGHFAQTVCAWAQQLNLTAILGMFTPSGSQRVRNTTLIAGKVAAHYDKIHLFDALGYQESAKVDPGNQLVLVKIDDVLVGIATCYDLRFADQFTALAMAGAEVIAVGSCWANGPTKRDQWLALTKARAMDAQAWLVAADQALFSQNDHLQPGVGASVIVSPLGQIVDSLADDPGMIITTIDLAQVHQVRHDLPILNHPKLPTNLVIYPEDNLDP